MSDRPCKVLCVDDHLDTLKLYNLILKQRGFVTALASSEEEARQQMQNQTFDLFILDGVLKTASGVSLCQEIKVSHPEAAILIVSGWVGAEEQQMALEAGADDVLSKPFDLGVFRETVERLVQGKCALGLPVC